MLDAAPVAVAIVAREGGEPLGGTEIVPCTAYKVLPVTIKSWPADENAMSPPPFKGGPDTEATRVGAPVVKLMV